MFFETLESDFEFGLVQIHGKAQKRRSHSDMRPRLKGRIPRRGQKAKRGSTGRARVKPLFRERIFPLHESLSQASLSSHRRESSSEQERRSTHLGGEEEISLKFQQHQTGGQCSRLKGRRGESRGGSGKGETSESTNPTDGFGTR